jgi:outer membrane protein TolC
LVIIFASPPAHAADLTFTDCLRIALEHNPDLRTASGQYLAAEGQALKLHAILYPAVSAQGITAPATVYVQINQVLFSRATFPQLRISRLGQDQATINYRQTLADVVFQLRQAFTTALGARRSDELLQQFASRQGRTVATARQLFQAGEIEKSAELGVEVSANDLAQLLQSSQLDVIHARFALSRLLGEELPPTTGLTGDLAAVRPPERLDVAALTAEALRNRPDLQLLESLRLTQDQQIVVNQANALPVVGFSSNSAFQPPALGLTSNFDLERNYNEPEVQRQEGNSQLPLSLYMNWSIFDGGSRAGLRASDEATLASQDVAVAELRRSIPGEVAFAVSTIRAEEATLRALDAQTSSDELRHSAELDYQAGRIRQLDLAHLEGDILQHDQLHLAAQVRLNLAVAALDHALGRGLQTKTAPSSANHP